MVVLDRDEMIPRKPNLDIHRQDLPMTELYAIAGMSLPCHVHCAQFDDYALSRFLSDSSGNGNHVRELSWCDDLTASHPSQVAEEVAECQRVLEKTGLQYHVRI